ncbi:MAG: DUF1302 family protein [Gammaproteobacteria bacterium]
MKHTFARALLGGAVVVGGLYSSVATAIDWNITGFIRQEIAYGLNENPNNRSGNPFNNRVSPLVTYAGADAGFGAGGVTANGTIGGLPYGTGANAVAPTSLHVDTVNGRIGGLFSEATQGLRNGVLGNFAVTAGPVAGTRVGLPAGFYPTVPYVCQNQAARAADLGGRVGLTGFGPRPIDGQSTFPNQFAASCPSTGGLGAGYLLPGDPYKNYDDSTIFNTFNTRAELDIQAKFNNEFSAYMKLRAFYDASPQFTDAYIGDQFKSQMWGSRGTVTEWNSPDAIIDIPALYVDWNRGPLWIRLGNQVIAWGEAYFFRTMDVANGLDLRRHLTLGPGAEEYQDQRIASPGVRLSYTFDNGWELDAFGQLFSPTILPAQESPYNLVPTYSATLDERIGMDDAEGAWNYGMRLTMPLTEQFTGIIGWVNRRNQDGVFAGVDRPHGKGGNYQSFTNPSGCANDSHDVVNLFAQPFGFGQFFGSALAQGLGVGDPNFGTGSLDDARQGFANLGVPMPTKNGSRVMANGCGNPFYGDLQGPQGVHQVWSGIQDGRIDGLHATRALINEFPTSKWEVRDIFGFGDEYTFADLARTVDGFRTSYGPIGTSVGRYFKRENIFMVGGNYVVNSDNEWLDQLIVRGEVAVTPNKRITNDLSQHYTKVDDVVSALILEKYQRLSSSFPATYMVAQWMHRTSTDLFGRDLDKMNAPGISTFIDPVTGDFTPAAFDPDAVKPRGISSANYVVFAFQQPFPNLIWRLDMSLLVDVAGGYLVQPGVRYRPSAKWQWDLYATVIGSPGGDNDTITETIDFADEIFARLTYFF